MFTFYLLIGCALVLGLVAASRWYARASPRQVVTGLKVAATVGGGLAALWLVLSGRALGLVYLLLPFLPAAKAWFRRVQNSGAAPTGRTSDVETAWLRMSLDHDSGTMDGLVLQGSWHGKRLGELDAPSLLALLAELRVADPDSAALLEGYLDAVHAGWRAAEGPASAAPAGGGAPLTREEAYRILGLEPGADDEAVRAAYRDLMKRVHPDQGGSAYLAAKLNQAKALLIGE